MHLYVCIYIYVCEYIYRERFTHRNLHYVQTFLFCVPPGSEIEELNIYVIHSSIYIYTCIYTYLCIYIYIYLNNTQLVYLYIYIYVNCFAESAILPAI